MRLPSDDAGVPFGHSFENSATPRKIRPQTPMLSSEMQNPTTERQRVSLAGGSVALKNAMVLMINDPIINTGIGRIAMNPSTNPAVWSAVFEGTCTGATRWSRRSQQAGQMGLAAGRVRRSHSRHMKLPQRPQTQVAGASG